MFEIVNKTCSEGKGPEASFAGPESIPFVLSFDVGEHDLIEAAVGLDVGSELKADYRQRMRRMTEWVLAAFSVVKQTAWALDVLAELGLVYDSSIYPVRHDRYGVPDAPRGPFMARGSRHEILEIPPATVRLGTVTVPVGGGGYFRLFPYTFTKIALWLSRRDPRTGATVLYFHPWEFDPDQPRLPLTRLNRFRTYVGIQHSQRRLTRLLSGYPFMRAVDLAGRLRERHETLPRFCPAS